MLRQSVRSLSRVSLRPLASHLDSRLPHAGRLTAICRVQPQRVLLRPLSEAKKEPKPDAKDEETSEIVSTPGEQVVAGARLTMWAGVAVFAGFCAYFIGKELIPTKMSPNRVFDRSFEVIRNDTRVTSLFGEHLKAYGRDHGGHREGRRNFVEHTDYTDPQDGSARTRIRYNLEGPKGRAFVFAEVAKTYDGFVYILVQDKATGQVITVEDNRAAMTTARLSSGEVTSAMSQLLTGQKKD